MIDPTTSQSFNPQGRPWKSREAAIHLEMIQATELLTSQAAGDRPRTPPGIPIYAVYSCVKQKSGQVFGLSVETQDLMRISLNPQIQIKIISNFLMFVCLAQWFEKVPAPFPYTAL